MSLKCVYFSQSFNHNICLCARFYNGKNFSKFKGFKNCVCCIKGYLKKNIVNLTSFFQINREADAMFKT